MIATFDGLFRFTWFPVVLQIFALNAFALFLADGLAANTEDIAFAKVLRNTNTANLIVWSYWWPEIILSAIFLGRVWCRAESTAPTEPFRASRMVPGFLIHLWDG